MFNAYFKYINYSIMNVSLSEFVIEYEFEDNYRDLIYIEMPIAHPMLGHWILRHFNGGFQAAFWLA